MEGPKTSNRRDMVVGAVLFSFATAWTITVYVTVPIGRGIGPRAFPLVLGITLMVLSAVLVFANLRRQEEAGPVQPDPGVAEPGTAEDRAGLWLTLRVMAYVCITIALYGYLMQKIGFVAATFLTVVLTLFFTLKERSPFLVLGMGIGITLGSWIVFGRILGAYIPRGTWISLF